MGLLGGMKEKLGFGGEPEWKDDGYYDEGGDYEPEAFDAPIDDEPARNNSNVVGFDDYNPNNFSNIVVNGSHAGDVAIAEDYKNDPFEPATSAAYGSSSVRNIGTHSGRSSSSRPARDTSVVGADASWSSPEDPSFLDNPAPRYNRDIHDMSSGVSSTSRNMRTTVRSSALVIIVPTSYSDVEKIAEGSRLGKTVVLSLTDVRPELAKRILDFSFGVASALNGTVDKAAEKVFVISRGSGKLTDADRETLRKEGILK